MMTTTTADAALKSQLGAALAGSSSSSAAHHNKHHHHHHHQKKHHAGGGGAAQHRHQEAPEGGGGAAGGSSNEEEDLESEEMQLSHDLALFLSNPSLRAALADGSLDLASYSTTVQNELRDLETDCIAAYRSKADEIRVMKHDVTNCQNVLSSLKEMLLGFQADLGGLSGEIRNLQEKSRTLDVQLKNRRSATHGLRQFLERTLIAPNLAHTITTGSVNPIFLQSVQELNIIYQNCHENKPQLWSCDFPPNQTVSCSSPEQLQTVTHRLRLVAVTRIRDYFLEQMALLRRPQTNVRMIQVHGLLKYAALQDFLGDACPEIANEILHVYVESMSKTLLQLFRTYHQQLLQLDVTSKAATRHDVIAIDDASLRDGLTTRVKKRSGVVGANYYYDVFCLGRRASDCLETTTSTTTTSTTNEMMHQQQQPIHQPILAHVALAEGMRYPYERLFRSILGHLVDAVTNEHIFGRQFFQRDIFNALFPSTLSYLTEQVENYLFGCYDALCLLLMIKVTHSYRRICRSRKIASLDPFFDQITKLLWPRLKTVMDGHLRSIQHSSPAKLNLDPDNLHVHYVSRRFAEFCCSLLLILHNKSSSSSSGGHGHGGTTAGGGGAAIAKPSALGRRRSSTGVRAVATAATAGEEGSATPTKATTTEAGAAAGLKTPSRDAATASTSVSTTTTTPPSTKRGSVLTTGSDHSAHLHTHKSAGDKLLEDLSEMIDEYVVLLNRLAEEHTSQKKRNVFLINNLDHVVCIFQERRVVGKEFNRFVEMLMHQRELFVEEELLTTGFSKMIAFVQQTEAHLSSLSSTSAATEGTPQGQQKKPNVNPQVVESLVLDFASNWKGNIDQMNRNVLSYFSNFRNGMEILKQVLTQLLLYYTRFHDIIRKVWPRNKPPAFCKDLVPTNLILTEIKKYALSI